jgi:prenyltransferase beta subunit
VLTNTPQLIGTLLCQLVLGSLAIGYPSPAKGQDLADVVTVDAGSVVAYLQSCRKPNGAFGPADQEYTDAAWNYPAVHALRLLGEPIARPHLVLTNGLGSPPGHVGYGHWQFFHEHQTRSLLQEPFQAEQQTITLAHQGFEPRYYGSPFGAEAAFHFKPPTGEERTALDRSRQQLGFYNLSSLYYLLAGLQASQRQVSNSATLVEFIRERQAPGGGFVDVRIEKPEPRDEEAHIAHTFQAVAAFKLLGEEIPRADQVADFIHACQRNSGGFGRNSNPKDGQEDVYYTWAALRALELLGKRPRRVAECTRSIQALQNADGGFGDRQGWRSRLYSTFYAVHALQILHGDPRKGIISQQVRRPRVKAISQGDLRIYQALFKMPVVQPKDLPELSRRGFHLLGLKSAKFADAQPLLAAIGEQQLAMDVILTPEAYPHRLTVAGGLMLNHVGNFTLDSRWTQEQRARWQVADEVGQAGKPWITYREQVLRPLQELKCLCYPEQDFELEHAYVAYDQAGYNAVLAGFNWAPRDFVRVFPWRERYVGRLAPIADADAHGDLEKWSDQLDHTRMLFIARGPTYADFLEAAVNERVVCVVVARSGVASGFACYGPPAATEFVRKHVKEWRWWDK